MKRVLIVYSDLMLNAGVESLLTREMDLKVMGIMLNEGSTFALEVERFRPHVIILDESSRLTELSTLISLLESHPDVRVMVLKVDDNRVHIYEKHEIEVNHSSDLVLAIRQHQAASRIDPSLEVDKLDGPVHLGK